MKKLLAIFFILFSISVSAQKSDTLVVPLGKYHFIKIDNKVYKINTTIEEVVPELKVESFPIWTLPYRLDTTYNIHYYDSLGFFKKPDLHLWNDSTFPLIDTLQSYYYLNRAENPFFNHIQ